MTLKKGVFMLYLVYFDVNIFRVTSLVPEPEAKPKTKAGRPRGKYGKYKN